MLDLELVQTKTMVQKLILNQFHFDWVPINHPHLLRCKNHIRHEIGPIAVPSKIEFVTNLPKTRSGKIMRRVLKARAMGLPEGDTSTLEE